MDSQTIRYIEPGFYVYDARRYLTALDAYGQGDYRRFDRVQDAQSYADSSPRNAIDLVTTRQEVG